MLLILLFITLSHCWLFSVTTKELALAENSQVRVFSESDEDCAKDAFEKIGLGCASMNDDERRKFASLVSLCHLAKSRRNPPTFECTHDMSGSDCAKLFDPDHTSIFDLYFVNVEVMCTIGEKFGMIRKMESTITKLHSSSVQTVNALMAMQTDITIYGDKLNAFREKVDDGFEGITDLQHKALDRMNNLTDLVTIMENKTLSILKNLLTGVTDLAKAQEEASRMLEGTIALNRELLAQGDKVKSSIREMNIEITTQADNNAKIMEKMQKKATSSIEMVIESVSPITEMYNQIKTWQRLFIYFGIGLCVYWFTMPSIFEPIRRLLLLALIIVCYLEKQANIPNPIETYFVFCTFVVAMNILIKVFNIERIILRDQKLPVKIIV